MKESNQPAPSVAPLTEEQEFLLRSLDDLEIEYSKGDLSNSEYVTLRNDYTRRLAAATRTAAGSDATSLEKPRNYFWWVSAIVLIGISAGYAVAQFSGLRAPGEPLSGEIDRSPRNRLSDARNLFFSDDMEGARVIVEEVLRDAPKMSEALVLSARIHERMTNPLAAIRQLDEVLEGDPINIDALTLRGWILVRIDDPDVQEEGIESLDQAISLQPDGYDPYIFRGFVARELEGNLDLAIQMYEMALDRDPPNEMQTQLNRIIEEMTSALNRTSG